MADQLANSPPEMQCPACEGQGRIPVGEHFVTRDMASDACEPSMEGMSMGIEYAQCEECDGTGLIAAVDNRNAKV